MKEIITIYKPGGEIVRKPVGYAGSTCFEATRPYDEAHTGEHIVEEGECAAAPQQIQQQQKA